MADYFESIIGDLPVPATFGALSTHANIPEQLEKLF